MSWDPTSLGAQISHININSQILLADGPQPPTEKTPNIAPNISAYPLGYIPCAYVCWL